MSERIVRTASKVGYSSLAFISTFALLWPVHNAAAQESLSVPVPDMVVDLFEAVPLALLVAWLVEILRLAIPWLSRKRMAGDESYDGPKNAIRLISVLVGALFGALGYASSMGDGSDPRQLGGIASGCMAALFGGQLMPLGAKLVGAAAARFRVVLKALRSKP